MSTNAKYLHTVGVRRVNSSMCKRYLKVFTQNLSLIGQAFSEKMFEIVDNDDDGRTLVNYKLTYESLVQVR